MPVWLIIVIVLVVLVLLAAGGIAANARHERRTRQGFRSSLSSVDRQLAAAHAADRGWEPSRLEAAARLEFETRHPDGDLREVSLVSVLDRPGTDEDEAVFRLLSDRGSAVLRLGRRGDEWFASSYEEG